MTAGPAMSIRFHLDESVHGAIAEGLRRRGVDVTTSVDVRLLSASDEEQLVYAREHGRVLVTHDSDFLRLAARGVEHHGIAYCHIHRRSVRSLIGALLRMWHARTGEEMRGRVEYL